jgi:hypothetical protein
MNTVTSNQGYQPLLRAEQSSLVRSVIRNIDAGSSVTDTFNPTGSWAAHYYLGKFTGAGAGQQTEEEETTDRIHYLTEEETRQMDAPFPPEPGYDD